MQGAWVGFMVSEVPHDVQYGKKKKKTLYFINKEIWPRAYKGYRKDLNTTAFKQHF